MFQVMIQVLILFGFTIFNPLKLEVNHHKVYAQEKTKKKKRKRRKKEYKPRQKAAEALMSSGHPTIELSIKVEPRVRARIYNGKEFLGVAPFTIRWPKDTGALDIVAKADGFITINSRLYTYKNDQVILKLVKESESYKLFGYKKKVEDESTVSEESSE